MERPLALVAVLIVGGLIALQPPVNSQLAKHSSVIAAAFISTAISALVLGILVLLSGQFDAVRRATGAPPGYLTGGLMGAILVAVTLVTVRKLGAGGVVAALVTGQLIVAAILDRLGVLGLTQIGFTPARVTGFALLIAGTALVSVR